MSNSELKVDGGVENWENECSDQNDRERPLDPTFSWTY